MAIRTARKRATRRLLQERDRIYARHVARLPWDERKPLAAMTPFEHAGLLVILGARDFIRIAEIEDQLAKQEHEDERARLREHAP